MNSRHIIVAVITIIVIVAAVIVSQQRAPQASKEKTRLFPEFVGKINDVSEINVRDGQTTLTIQRVSGKWKVVEADDYPALVEEVKQTVLAVSDLRVIAEKTTNPDLYKKLGVEAPGNQGATSHLLTVKSNGDELASMIVGNARRSKSPSSAPGLYVRIPGQAQALLVEGKLSVSTDIIQWIKNDIINIEADRVSAIHIRPRGEPEIHLKKENPGDDLVLQNIPEGKEQQSEYLVTRMAALLEYIYVDGVRNEDSIDYSSPDSIISVKTFDGLTANAEVKKSGGHTFARFSFTAEPGETVTEDDTDEAPEAAGAEEEDTITPEQEAENLNSSMNGWAYQLSESKAKLFTQSLSDLIRDPESEATEDTESTE